MTINEFAEVNTLDPDWCQEVHDLIMKGFGVEELGFCYGRNVYFIRKLFDLCIQTKRKTAFFPEVRFRYWSDEDEIQQSLNPTYYPHELTGEELEMFNQITKTDD